MKPTRLEITLLADVSAPMQIGEVIGIFHRWIQRRALPGLWIDVADYRHVVDGPGIMLVGHEADLSLGRSEGQAGLTYFRKRDFASDWPSQLRQACDGLHQAAELLQEQLGLRWRYDALQLRVLDRLQAPNDDASLAALLPHVQAVLPVFFEQLGQPTAQLSVRRQGDDRRPLTLEVKRQSQSSDWQS